MGPIIILDATALHGPRALRNADLRSLFTLSQAGVIELIVPSVVLLEVARQWSESVAEASRTLAKASSDLNALKELLGAPTLTFTTTEHPRSEFAEHTNRVLLSRGAKVPGVPAIKVEDLLQRDLDAKKPFSRSGAGFRDALVWATIVDTCSAFDAPFPQVVFVTNNKRDFVEERSSTLHPDLQQDLPVGLPFRVVSSLKSAIEIPEVNALLEPYLVAERLFLPERLEAMVDQTLSDLTGTDLSRQFGYCSNDGYFETAFQSVLSEPTLEEIYPDNDTLVSSVHRDGSDELTLRVSVEADCGVDGFIDKGEYLMEEDLSLTSVQDWNRHVFRASEERRLRFLLSAVFIKGAEQLAELSVDDLEVVL